MPQYGVEKVEQKAIAPARLNINAPIEAFGGGAANTALPALGKAADTISDVLYKEEIEANQLVNKGFKNEMDAYHLDQHKEGGAFTAKGYDAFTSAPDRMNEGLDKRKEDLLSRANNDSQKQFINNEYNSVKMLMNQKMLDHSTRERDEYHKEQTTSTVYNNKNLAIEAYRNPDAVKAANNAMAASLVTYGKSIGMPDDKIKELVHKNVSDTNKKIVERYIANNDTAGARDFYYNKQYNNVHGDDKTDIERMLKDGGTKEAAFNHANELIDKYNDISPALVELRNTVKDPKVLEESEHRLRVLMHDKNQNAIQQRDSEFIAAKKEYEEMGQVSPAKLGGLMPDAQEYFKEMDLIKAGIKTVPKDNTTYLKYTDMPMRDMAKVSAAELIKIEANTTPDQYRTIQENWQLARDGINGDENSKLKYHSNATDRANGYQVLKDHEVIGNNDTAATINKNATKRKIVAKFEEEVRKEIDSQTHKSNGKLSEDEIKNIQIKVASKVVPTTGWFGMDSEVKYIEMTDENISKVRIEPKDEKIFMNAARVNGIPTTTLDFKENMRRAKLFIIQNGEPDTDRKRKALANILRGKK